ncbi:hypothetical protein M3T53_07255 [Actinomyces sp. B33]|uniref:hypothetical protein n=1 Tax=Actinomyces sp. B33 TaxID=2942131 RepID=UPI002341325E|nr:hypothetical protein [Actinomyces sp. B33]MDC4233502.1 hypothetical protein [Actinomyces sp. B33]
MSPVDRRFSDSGPAAPGARQRILLALRGGATVRAAAAQAGVSPALAEVIVDEMTRQGLVDSAQSLCASGLGMCGGADSDEARLHCSGCPILPLAPAPRRLSA